MKGDPTTKLQNRTRQTLRERYQNRRTPWFHCGIYLAVITFFAAKTWWILLILLALTALAFAKDRKLRRERADRFRFR